MEGMASDGAPYQDGDAGSVRAALPEHLACRVGQQGQTDHPENRHLCARSLELIQVRSS